MKNKNSWISIVIYTFVIVLLNIMKVIVFPNGISFNTAAADFVLLPVILLLVISLKKYLFSQVFETYWLFLLLLIWIILSNILASYTASINDSGITGFIGEFIKTSICVGYFFIGFNTLRYIKLTLFFRLWTIGALIFFIYGFFANFCVTNGYLQDFIDAKNKLYFLGTYTDPNHAATYITINVYMMLLALRVDKKKITRVFYIIILALCPIALMLTDSRGGVIGFVASVFVLSLLYIRKNKNLLVSGMLMLAIGALLAFIVDGMLADGYISEKIIRSVSNFSGGLQTRLDLAKTALQMGNEHFVFGVGRGNFILNSAPYLIDEDIKLLNVIPHNTYLGLYAEVGIIGTILYFTPLLLIIRYTYNVYKSSQEWIRGNIFFYKVLIAASVGIGIQAAVLNMENRRTLWFLAGIVVYLIKEKNIQIKDLSFFISKLRLAKISLTLSVLLIILYIFGIFNVSYRQTLSEEEANYMFKIPISSDDIGKEFTLDYKVIVQQEDFEGETVEVSIVETSINGVDSIRNRYTYSLVNGIAKMKFMKKENDSCIYFKVDKLAHDLDVYNILPIRIYNEEGSIDLTRNYFLTPMFMRDTIYLSKVEPLIEEYQPILGDTTPISFENKIILEDVKVKEMNNKKIIELDYVCMESLEGEYTLWMYGIPDNIHNIKEKRFNSGNEYYYPMENVLTSEWIPGNTYTITYEFPRNVGWYQLHCGFFKKVDNEVIRLYVEGKDIYIAELGWFNAGD